MGNFNDGHTVAGIMAGVNGCQTNKYSTATATGGNHDDFSGNENSGQMIIKFMPLETGAETIFCSDPQQPQQPIQESKIAVCFPLKSQNLLLRVAAGGCLAPFVRCARHGPR